jgi:hypothetical protein
MPLSFGIEEWNVFRSGIVAFVRRPDLACVRSGELIRPLDAPAAKGMTHALVDDFIRDVCERLSEVSPLAQRELPAIREILRCAYASAEGLPYSPGADRALGLPAIAAETLEPRDDAPFGLSDRAARDLHDALRGFPRQARILTEMPALIVNQAGQGHVFVLTLQTVADGAGVLYPAHALALGWRTFDFQGACQAAFAWAQNRFDLGKLDVRFTFDHDHWAGRPALSGASAGAAFAFGLARLLAQTVAVVPRPGFELVRHLRDLDPLRVTFTASIDPAGTLGRITEPEPKIEAVRVYLLARGVETLVVARDQEPRGLAPAGLRIRRHRTLDDAVAALSAAGRRLTLEVLLAWLLPSLAIGWFFDPGASLAHPTAVGSTLVATMILAILYVGHRLPLHPTPAFARSSDRPVLSVHGLYTGLAVAFALGTAWYFSFLGAGYSAIGPVGVAVVLGYVFFRVPGQRLRAGLGVVTALLGLPLAAAARAVPELRPLRWVAVRTTELRGLDLRNRDLQWLHADPTQRLDLSEADLRGAILHHAVLTGAVLDRARLREAMLQKVDLSGATLMKASMPRAHLDGAILDDARLNDACARHASLSNASLAGAELAGTDLSGADLAGIRGLVEERLELAKGNDRTKLPAGMKIHCANCLIVTGGKIPYAPECKLCGPVERKCRGE